MSLSAGFFPAEGEDSPKEISFFGRQNITRKIQQHRAVAQRKVSQMMSFGRLPPGIDQQVALLISPLQNGLAQPYLDNPVLWDHHRVQIKQMGIPQGKGISVAGNAGGEKILQSYCEKPYRRDHGHQPQISYHRGPAGDQTAQQPAANRHRSA